MKRLCLLVLLLLLTASSVFAQQRTTNRNSAAILSSEIAKECVMLIEGITPYMTAHKVFFPGRPLSEEENKSICSGSCPVVPPTPWTEFVTGERAQRFGDGRSFVYIINKNDFYLVNNVWKTVYRTLANVTRNGVACGTWEVEKK